MKITETESERRQSQSQSDKREAHIRIINNGFLVKTDRGWYAYKTESDVFTALSTYFKSIARG